MGFIQRIFIENWYYITEPRWREVFLLTTELLDNPDHFLQLFKCKIDSSLEKDLQIQGFLSWVDRKSQSLPNVYKPAAIRAFYYALAHDSPGYGFEVKTNKMPINAVFDIDLALATALALAEALAFNQNIINAFQGNFDNTRSLASDMGFNPGFQVALTTGGIDEDSLAKAIGDCLNRACIHTANLKIQLEQPLKEFVDTLHKFDIVPDIRNSSETENKINARREWWQNQGKTWTEQLRALIIEHRNIGHVWNFNPDQKELIQFYCDASILLVNCLNSGCKVSNWAREEIEETLLLPMAEIERIKSERLKTSKTVNEQ